MALGRGDGKHQAAHGHRSPRNPLELRPAFVFGAAFVAMLVLTQLAVRHVGRGGLYGLAAIMGFGDIDPFVLGLTQRGAAASAPPHAAAAAIVIAASANGVAKAVYARLFGGRKAGALMLASLLVLAVVGLVPLIWI